MSNLTITVARCPLSGTVAKNAIKWGTGGLNIDPARIGIEGEASPAAARRKSALPIHYTEEGRWKDRRSPESYHAERPGEQLGRWPANVILVHKVGCRLVGTKQVPGHPGYPNGPGGKTMHYSSNKRSDEVRPNAWAGHADEDGLEAIEDWECVDGCPVAELDQQTGLLPTGVWNRQTDGAHPFGEAAGSPYDTWQAVEEAPGGASRFFKQVQETAMGVSLPQEMISYLCNMIGAPGRPGIYWSEINDTMISCTPDNSIPGLVLRGEPTEDQAKELMRILMPGAFLLLVAPEERPTGHVGAIRIEDVGFEIRDAILVVREGGEFHYVAKASRSEREAGCEHLEAKTGAAAVDREEDTAGLNSPRAGAGRTAETVRNFHPTCKPVEIMERLLDDVPKDAVVLDPFLGSGTTAIACRRSGHSCLGIDREEDYLRIADARIRHWDRELLGEGAVIETPFPPREIQVEQVDLTDLFGWGD